MLGTHKLSEAAHQVLGDPIRRFVVSDFLALELLPKATYHRRIAEANYYRDFFAAAHRTVKASSALIAEARQAAERFGLSAWDALHVAAAKRAKCIEFVTTEGRGKPFFRVGGIRMLSLGELLEEDASLG